MKPERGQRSATIQEVRKHIVDAKQMAAFVERPQEVCLDEAREVRRVAADVRVLYPPSPYK